MPLLNVVDETFIVAPVSELRAILCDETRWRDVRLDISCYEDRGPLGKRWTLGGDLTGTAEIWFEEAYGGVIVHAFLRADPVRRTRVRVLERRHVRPLKRWILEVKRGHDLRRPAGLVGVRATTVVPHSEPDEEG